MALTTKLLMLHRHTHSESNRLHVCECSSSSGSIRRLLLRAYTRLLLGFPATVRRPEHNFDIVVNAFVKQAVSSLG